MLSAPQTTVTITTIRALPADDSARHHALALLHDHPAMIRLGPLMQRYERIPPSSPAETSNAYIITDKLPYLPFGLWTGELSIYAEFVDTEEGLVTKVRAPGGFVSEGVWKVKEEGGERWAVEERMVARCPWGMGWYVEGTTRKAHEAVLGRFVAEVRARMEGKDGEGKAKVDGVEGKC
ncbi:hypothetical protein B0J12DRAFT_734618 [Macrophomina phaseolina]|uniref:DUF7053 domain-containing protein n=1 Tax=Macrophomina phaseolina TaxID=35725 RepID=A0ABQ8GVJ5_9PEZI|nr:hypothetical protein B0J12DRAFT_734618 [Macrophomina phaseolina]